MITSVSPIHGTGEIGIFKERLYSNFNYLRFQIVEHNICISIWSDISWLIEITSNVEKNCHTYQKIVFFGGKVKF